MWWKGFTFKVFSCAHFLFVLEYFAKNSFSFAFELKYQCQKVPPKFPSIAAVGITSISQLCFFIHFSILKQQDCQKSEHRKHSFFLKWLWRKSFEEHWAQKWILPGGCFVDHHDCSGCTVKSFKYFLLLFCEWIL